MTYLSRLESRTITLARFKYHNPLNLDPERFTGLGRVESQLFHFSVRRSGLSEMFYLGDLRARCADLGRMAIDGLSALAHWFQMAGVVHAWTRSFLAPGSTSDPP